MPGCSTTLLTRGSVFFILDFLVGVSHHILNGHQGSGVWFVFENSENREELQRFCKH